jgi:hypothetical protein
LLTEGDDSSKSAFAISNNPSLREEAARLVPLLEAAKAPMSREQFAIVMAEQRPLYGVQDMEPTAWANALESYFAVLRDFSEGMLRDAFERWNRGEGMKDPLLGQFFPKPAQLYVLAKKSKADVWTAVYRARKSLERAERDGAEWTPERKAAERQKMIDQGLLTPDGKPNFSVTGKTIPDRAPTRTREQLAAQLLAKAERTEEIGDVV